MSDMLDMNDPTLWTFCHQNKRRENDAVCERCAENLSKLVKADQMKEFFAKLSGQPKKEET